MAYFITYSSKWLGIQDLKLTERPYMYKFFVLKVLIQLASLLTSTFMLLYVLEYESFFETGILLSIQYIVQMSLDYPSGNLGDYIGHKWVLFIAMVSYSISFLCLYYASAFYMFLLVYFMTGIAKSQESGALESWLGKLKLSLQILGGIAILIGGLLASILSRKIVFMFQIFLYAIIAIISIKTLNKIETTITVVKTSYKTIFRQGLLFITKTRPVFIYLLGILFFSMMWMIWTELVLIPMYFGYTGSDSSAGLFRTLAYFLGIFLVPVGTKLSIKIDKKRISELRLAHGLFFFCPLLMLFLTYPFQDQFTIIPILIYCIIAFFFPVLDLSSDILERELFLGIVPNEIRNSFYSLLSTLTAFCSIPGLIIGGFIIEQFGFPAIMIIILLLLLLSSALFKLGLKGMVTETQL